VESERPNAFQDEDLRFLEGCATTIASLFAGRWGAVAGDDEITS
jgi:hypothetical protein